MKINIKDQAETYLASKISAGKHVFLALDDGSSKFSKLGGSCAIGNKFQLVVADQEDPEYSVTLENNAGFTMTTAEPETTFLGNGLALDYKNASLRLTDDSGVLDGAVTVDTYQAPTKDKQAMKAEMSELGGKIC
ncbi:iron-sulfur cluster biosynthesis family protein [Pediococcus ethanolidurans]|uniref:iron-sulfur cluster biosynthesis family protein n=1 Tax=Pediococcus ethanolidurans TaxID=319653 RepID=UPI001C1EDDC7|nr:iron-sulfur cluster biosynthesis family protein [Pediococcus ethanolidurans]MBU7554074.1 iron-sulfur cluster biosynthesis family protein [Pediococcus ethanolidurans]MBU7564142.1 iron-sulfur cluster biosynthesis family protein [Pediococcus ethanolidurans]MCT4398683.1 iron-sulfur cluster biosynthesis family protein [Pediococcus ethanolidurans]MCV3314655.1 iron-sulfur cluster biosynthesis family protein [Pediococcus ethanolidurans]MCV3322053.1 iron-sulfur cluster biosynthesis family protein [P